MPELPEVQTVADELRREGILGLRICGVRVFLPRCVATPSLSTFRHRLAGSRIVDIGRRGKYLVFRLEPQGWLLVHLRMSGRLTLCYSRGESPDRHVRLVLSLSDGRELRFHDTRTFGRWYVVDNPERITGTLGPEPLEKSFTVEVLAAKLKNCHRMLKPLLLDQRIIAGLGNIYVDEALWEARLHPKRPSSSLGIAEVRQLHRAIRTVLKRGLRNGGTSLGSGEGNFYSVAGRRGRNSDSLRVFGRDGLPCFRCGHTITRIVVSQRGTHVCSICQK